MILSSTEINIFIISQSLKWMYSIGSFEKKDQSYIRYSFKKSAFLLNVSLSDLKWKRYAINKAVELFRFSPKKGLQNTHLPNTP